MCGGSLAGAALGYHYSTEFRHLVRENLPVIEPLLSSLNSYLDNQNQQSGTKQTNAPKDPRKLPFSSEPLNLGAQKDDAFPLKKPANFVAGKKEPTASVSSIDQTAISAVDLAIASTVEKEARQVNHKTETKPDSSHDTVTVQQPPKSERDKVESPTAAVSVLDHIGVSAIDLDVAASVEKEADAAKADKISKQSGESGEKEKQVELQGIREVDTSLTEKEVEAMVDKTAMELMVHQALAKLQAIGQDAVEAHKKAASAVKAHVEQLKAALAQSQQEGSLKDLSEMVLNSQKVATDCVAAAKAAQVRVNEEVEKLHSMIKEAETAGASEAGTTATAEAARVSYDVQKAALDMQQSKAEAAVLEGHQKDLQESKEVFKKELLDIIPGALSTQTGEGAVEDKNVRSESVLLAYARKRLEQLTKELSNYQAEEQKRLDHSLKVQREEDAKLTELKLKQEAERMMAEFETSLKKKEAQLAEVHESTLRQQLRRQAAAYGDHLAEVLRVQAVELDNRHKEDLQQKLNAEKSAFETQLSGALAHLRGVESVVEGRADIEKQNRQSQKLWAACQSLASAIDRGIDRPSPLLAQLTAINDAAADDPLVSQVLKSLPEEAVTRGVLNEENIRRRFYKVRRWCRRVAMIGDNGASPWTHLLSYFQSFFIFDSFDPVKEGELVDAENADTFDLLARADYYLRHGDLELATRLVNQLRGEPRNVARDWLIEARLLLETRQAANLLTAYAAVLGTAGSE